MLRNPDFTQWKLWFGSLIKYDIISSKYTTLTAKLWFGSLIKYDIIGYEVYIKRAMLWFGSLIKYDIIWRATH